MSKLPLEEEYVIFTGLSRTQEAVDLTTAYGGSPVVSPFITTQEVKEAIDGERLMAYRNKDWFIFTSQSSVAAFVNKIERYGLTPLFFQAKIAAVGAKTKAALENNGFVVHFIPTTYSADVFIKEFPKISLATEKCVFFKGNLAKQTIVDGLPNEVEEWIIYETLEIKENVERVKKLLESGKSCSLVFTSPSSVKAFHANVGKEIDYNLYTVCAIGHITKQYLESLEIPVQVMPNTYTILELVNKLAAWKGREQ